MPPKQTEKKEKLRKLGVVFKNIMQKVQQQQNKQLLYQAFMSSAKFPENYTEEMKADYFNKELNIIVWVAIFRTGKQMTQFDDFLICFCSWLEKQTFPIKKDQHVLASGRKEEDRDKDRQKEERDRKEREKKEKEELERREMEERERMEREEKQRIQKAEKERIREEKQRQRAQQIRRERQRQSQRQLEQQRRIQHEKYQKQQRDNAARQRHQNQQRIVSPNSQTRSNPQYLPQSRQNTQESRQGRVDISQKDDIVKKIMTKIADVIDNPQKKCRLKAQIYSSLDELKRIETFQKTQIQRR